MTPRLGDFLLVLGGDADRDAVQAQLARDEAWPPWAAGWPTRSFAPAPGVRLWTRGEVVLHDGGAGAGGVGLCLEPLSQAARSHAVALGLLQQWTATRTTDPSALSGRFAFAFWDSAADRLVALTDRFRTCSLVQAPVGRGGVALATDTRLFTATGLVERRSDPLALYHYLNFAYVPAPASAIRQVRTLRPAQRLDWRAGRLSLEDWWQPQYPADLGGSEAQRAEALRTRMVAVVSRYGGAEAGGWGSYLSGGTDSTSIASILRARRAGPVRTFSVGFDEAGYDELGYAELAARELGLSPHEVRVSESDAVDALPRLAEAFDEPFGNSSAIPTFAGARLAAAHGVVDLVAGDGGDEIFGGNERYRKDVLFDLYRSAPVPLRWLGGGVSRLLAPLDWRPANRVRNFVRRAVLPQPDRFYTDDAFASEHFAALLTPGFREQVTADASLALQREIYGQTRADDELHRVMQLDLAMTIADNDAVKVVRAARLAGVQVAFPYLDPELIDFTGRLPARDKVRGLNKRHLFKLATRDLVPQAIRDKRKQGFALPVSVWLARPGPMRELARDLLFSRRAVERGVVEPRFVQALFDHHTRGAWDHGQALHSLVMLELWHRRYIDRHG